jgi:leukotriene-A4 hydrolase
MHNGLVCQWYRLLITCVLSTMPFMTFALNTDAHSAAKPEEAVIKHLSLDLNIDFSKHIITATAKYRAEFFTPSREIILDTRDLEIISVQSPSGSALKYTLGEDRPFLGKALSILVDGTSNEFLINYRTTPASAALQWLEPSQTGDGKSPFVFTQGQAILSRTWIPVQDSPGIRFTWDATVHVPAEFMAVMSGKNVQERNETGIYTCRMELPVPAYLIALAAGDIQFSPIGLRCGVYAEPGMLPKAAKEFADMEKMLIAAEQLYGPYAWGRYDVIVLPASFPFGGMENPRLTFATPTIIAGDGSLTALIAHELAHSWSGNLVTNSNWDDFWLNEGYTVYFERRIMEALYGKSYADMLEVLGYKDLKETLADLGTDNADTQLKLKLVGRDPDDGMTDIAYEKGCFLLVYLEDQVGRETFDAFLNRYFKEFAFKGITTERFLHYLKSRNGLKLSPEALAVVEKWIYTPGLPAECKHPVSERFNKVEALVPRLLAGEKAARNETQTWVTHEWLHFIRSLPETLDQSKAESLNKQYGFSQSGNSEIRFAWLSYRLNRGDATVISSADAFLGAVGRRKFVLPLYKAMMKQESMKDSAKSIYAKYRSGYHAVTRQSIDEIIGN